MAGCADAAGHRAHPRVRRGSADRFAQFGASWPAPQQRLLEPVLVQLPPASVVRKLSEEEFAQDDAESVQIGGGGCAFPGDHLGGEVCERPFGRGGARCTFDGRFEQRVGDSEIGDLRAPLTADQDVSRREITVDDPACMRSGESARNLRGDRSGTAWHERTDATQHRGEIFAVDELHDDRRRLALGGDIEHCGDVWMRDDRGGATLGAESRGGRWDCGECGAKDFHRHVSTERFVGGAEDGCRGAFADLFEESIAAGDQVSRSRCGRTHRSTQGVIAPSAVHRSTFAFGHQRVDGRGLGRYSR